MKPAGVDQEVRDTDEPAIQSRLQGVQVSTGLGRRRYSDVPLGHKSAFFPPPRQEHTMIPVTDHAPKEADR